MHPKYIHWPPPSKDGIIWAQGSACSACDVLTYCSCTCAAYDTILPASRLSSHHRQGREDHLHLRHTPPAKVSRTETLDVRPETCCELRAPNSSHPHPIPSPRFAARLAVSHPCVIPHLACQGSARGGRKRLDSTIRGRTDVSKRWRVACPSTCDLRLSLFVLAWIRDCHPYVAGLDSGPSRRDK